MAPAERWPMTLSRKGSRLGRLLDRLELSRQLCLGMSQGGKAAAVAPVDSTVGTLHMQAPARKYTLLSLDISARTYL